MKNRTLTLIVAIISTILSVLISLKFAFGIICFQNQTPYRIVLECSNNQKEYIKSFPLHDSQIVSEEQEDKCIFEMMLYPTYDFMQEILSYGKEVKVLEPEILINQIKEQLIF